jgi:hypothetical protein
MRRPRRVCGALAAVSLVSLLAGCSAAPRPSPAPLARDQSYAYAWLRQLLTLQRTYYEKYGRFAATADELSDVGWEPSPAARAYPWVVHHRRRLCVAVLPRGGARGTWSVDGDGRFHAGPYCGRLW